MKAEAQSEVVRLIAALHETTRAFDRVRVALSRTDNGAPLIRRRSAADPWESTVRQYLHRHDEIAITDILHRALKLRPERYTQAEVHRIARILHRLGWIKRRIRYRGERQYVYRAPMTTGGTSQR